MEHLIENRISRVRKSLFDLNLDTFLVLVGENRHYLSGFTGEDTQFDESAGALLITDSELILATDSRFDLQAANEAPLYEVYCYKEGLIKSLPDLLKRIHTGRLGFEGIRLTYEQHKKIVETLETGNLQVELVDTENVVENLVENRKTF